MKEPPRLLRLLLRLYPREHRRRYGPEMWEVVRYRCRSAGEGWWRRWTVATVAGADLVWNALQVRGDSVRRKTMGMGCGWGLDLRFVLRSLRRRPGYVATAVLVLTGAVAVNVAVLSFVRGTLLNEPSYPDADRVVVGWGSNVANGQLRDVVSGPNYIDMRERVTSLEALAAFHEDGRSLMEDGRPTVLSVHEVSVDFFDAVPVEPVLGRTFGDEHRSSGGPAAVIAAYAFWRDNLGADPGAVGRALPLDGDPHTLIGVLPEGFEFIVPADLYVPLGDDLLAADGRYRIHYHLIGRLRADASPGQASRELSAIMVDIAGEYPGYEGWSVLVERLHDVSVMAVRPVLLILSAAMVVVLLIALANLTTLFRIRTVAREDELGVRLALGAGRARIARILGLEAVGLAVLGTLLGVVVAPLLLDQLREMIPLWISIPDSAAQVPALKAVLDPWVAGSAVAVAVAGALGLAVPALLSAGEGRAAWVGRGRLTTRGTSWLVVGELALATVLCLGAGLTARSADKLLAVDVGVEDEGLLTLYFGDVWSRPVEEQVAYFRQVVERVEALPEVSSAALIDYIPFQQEDDYARIYFLDRSFQPVRDVREEWRRVSDGLVETAGMRLVQGRGLLAEDLVGRPRSAIVNLSFAQKHFPGGRAVGRFVSTHHDAYRDLEIVGVVADVRSNGPANPAPPILYVPLHGNPRGTTGMYARVSGGALAAAAEAVRDAIWSVDPSQPVDALTPMTELVSSWVAIPRAVRALVGGVAALALVLAGVGVFGVIGYAVRRRTGEFGVRMALGASPARLKRDVLSGALPLLALGLGGGVLLGALAGRGARAVLFEVDPLDPVSLLLAVVAMGGVGLLAMYLPARRAAGVDPTESMRVE